jgi:hypothetical protein
MSCRDTFVFGHGAVPYARSALPSHPLDRTPPTEKAPAKSYVEQPLARDVSHPPISIATPDSIAPPLLLDPLPTAYTAHYASFATFLSPAVIAHHWDDNPVIIDEVNSTLEYETKFLGTVSRAGRVCVDPEWFADYVEPIQQGTLIDVYGVNTSMFKYFATYTHLMDAHSAYIRIVAYNRDGLRCEAGHPTYGNRILVIPRFRNDVVFPVQLRFHAIHACEGCHSGDAHKRIREAAWNAMTA